jgi:hypothetical protein
LLYEKNAEFSLLAGPMKKEDREGSQPDRVLRAAQSTSPACEAEFFPFFLGEISPNFDLYKGFSMEKNGQTFARFRRFFFIFFLNCHYFMISSNR